MNCLVDTCVWIEHFRKENEELTALLKENRVLTHSNVVGELACGAIPERLRTLEDLLLLPRAAESSFTETLQFIQSRKLFSKGLGWVDCQILASAVINDARVMTLDKKLLRFVKVYAP